jgi:sigma-E factor negative regulatory protein RseA
MSDKSVQKPGSLNETVTESLSAMLDGEAEELELRRVLRVSESDPEVLRTWGRFSRVRDIVQSPAAQPSQTATTPLQPLSPDFAGRVAAAISHGEIEPSAAEPGLSPWQGFARLAIAASVALVVVVGMQNSLMPGSDTVLTGPAGPALATAAAPQDAAPAGQSAAPVVADVDSDFVIDPVARQRMVEYISTIEIKEGEPVQTEHLQDSPLYRLVNAKR